MAEPAGTSLTRIAVGGAAPYDVVVGPGARGAVAALCGPAERVAVVHPGALAGPAAALVDELRAGGRDARAVPVPDGEAAKDVAVAAQCWDALARIGLTRTDAVVGLGGGATTDLAGFVAATWLRGVRLVNVPTTLLGMVDAAVGGKTAVNVAAGKNLVGAFHPPAGVACDLDALRTLPAPEIASGLAEVVKAGFVADPAILELVEADPAAAARPGSPELRELVERSIRVKAAVVAADLTERGGREVLNYGHTLGHAIERVEGYAWRHGAAVSVGMCFAAALGRLAGRLDEPTAARHRAVLRRLGLPTEYRSTAWPQLLEAMSHDKKARGARLRFVVLAGLARPVLLEDPDPELLRAAYSEVAA
ncbi:MAG: 3-dehydroquinate synthase [Frankiaceae bacterium]